MIKTILALILVGGIMFLSIYFMELEWNRAKKERFISDCRFNNGEIIKNPETGTLSCRRQVWRLI